MCLTNKVFLFPVVCICYVLEITIISVSWSTVGCIQYSNNIEFHLQKFLAEKKKQTTKTPKNPSEICLLYQFTVDSCSSKETAYLTSIPVVSVLAQSRSSYLQHCDLMVPRIQVFLFNLILFYVVFRLIVGW